MAALLNALREIRANHPLGEQILGVIRSNVRHCERQEATWAVAEALYWVSYAYHEGQYDPLYLGQCTGFAPGMLHTSVQDSGDGLAIEMHDEMTYLLEENWS